MSSTDLPLPKLSERPPTLSPSCPACGCELRVVSIEPHHKYRNLDVRNFACDCGLTTSDLFARPPHACSLPSAGALPFCKVP